MNKSFFIAPNATVEDDVAVGDESKIWYFSHVSTKARLGRSTNVGDHTFIGKGVLIGDECKIGNNASICEGAIIKNRVFVGIGTAFTNVRKPKAYKKAKRYLPTIVDDDVSIGANCTIVAGVNIGKKAIIADGSVIIRDVPPGVMVAGNPARIVMRINEGVFHNE